MDIGDGTGRPFSESGADRDDDNRTIELLYEFLSYNANDTRMPVFFPKDDDHFLIDFKLFLDLLPGLGEDFFLDTTSFLILLIQEFCKVCTLIR